MGRHGSGWHNRSPNFNVRGPLSYERINELMEGRAHRRWERDKNERNIYDGNSTNYAVRWGGYHHPVTGVMETVACVRLYNTDILRFFKDGALAVSSYDSAVTRYCIGRLSRVHTSKFYQEGETYFVDVEGEQHPFDCDLEIAADGTVVSEHTSRRHVIDPDRRPEYLRQRRALRKAWRESGAFNRLLLGEFSELIERDRGGVLAYLPDNGIQRAKMFELLSTGAGPDEVIDVCTSLRPLARSVFGRPSSRDILYANELLAAQAFERNLLAAALAQVPAPKFCIRTVHTGMKLW